MRTFLRAAADETRLVFTDAGVLIIMVVAIVLYSFVYPVPYLNQVVKDVPVVLVDRDHSSLSRRLATMIDAHESIHVAAAVDDPASAEALVRAGSVTGIVTIPARFERDILEGRQTRVSANIDASYLLYYNAVLGGLLESTGTLSAGVEVARYRAKGKSQDAAMRARRPVGLDLRPLFNVIAGYRHYVVPAVFVLILQQTLLIGIGMTGGARRERIVGGRSAAIDVTGHPAVHVAARSLPYLLLYAANAFYYLGFMPRYYGYYVPGSDTAVALLTVPFLLAVTFFGFTLRPLFQRRETAMQALLFTSLPLVFLGGFAWPVEAIPGWLRAAAQVVPCTSAIPAFLRLTRMGADLADVTREAAVLWILAAMYFPAACVSEALIRRRSRTPQGAAPADAA
jgi:ABC-2 type transport system permease protein